MRVVRPMLLQQPAAQVGKLDRSLNNCFAAVLGLGPWHLSLMPVLMPIAGSAQCFRRTAVANLYGSQITSPQTVPPNANMPAHVDSFIRCRPRSVSSSCGTSQLGRLSTRESRKEANSAVYVRSPSMMAFHHGRIFAGCTTFREHFRSVVVRRSLSCALLKSAIWPIAGESIQ